MQAWVHSPLQLVIGPRRERGALDDLAHLLATEAEVVDGPHVWELYHFDLTGKRAIGFSSQAREQEHSAPAV